MENKLGGSLLAAPRLLTQKFVRGHLKKLRKYLQLDIRHKPRSAFNALNRIFINVHPIQLQLFRQGPLGQFGHMAPPQGCNLSAAEIICSIFSAVFKHICSP